ncbi:MAG: zf-HC2 domain-containing protein [Gemmatimonadaceae bacterium]
MLHPDEGLIHAWLDGELDPAEAARVEALVANDADWAVAAAEARGLIAASARIVGALDRVPANVIPHAAPAAPAARVAPRPASRRWVWQAAAVLALMTGSAVVLEREKPVLPVPPAPKADVAAATAQPAASAPQSAPIDSHARSAGAPKVKQQQQAADAKGAVAKKTRDATSELANANPAKPTERALDKDVAAGGARAANAPMAALAQSFAPEKLTRLPPSCFVQREPVDSASRIIRLSAAALADSIRLETLVLRGGGDTLAAVNGRFTAVRVRCPAP